MRHIKGFLLICFAILLFKPYLISSVFLYNEAVDNIQELNDKNFNSVVYGSDKIVFVEFYAHWCGYNVLL